MNGLHRAKQAFANFGRALHNLEEALAMPADNEHYRNSTILAFLLCYEQCWKAFKRVLESYEGIATNSPRQALQEAYQRGWLGEDDQLWLGMTTDRNLIAHTYKKEHALQIYAHVRQYAPLIRQAHDLLAATYHTLRED